MNNLINEEKERIKEIELTNYFLDIIICAYNALVVFINYCHVLPFQFSLSLFYYNHSTSTIVLVRILLSILSQLRDTYHDKSKRKRKVGVN